MDKEQNSGALEGEASFYLSLGEVSYCFNVSKEIILQIMDEGVVSAKKNDRDEWLFDSDAMRIIRTILRLHRDLGVNFPGAGLVLQLLEKIDRLEMLLQQKNTLSE